MDLEIIGYSIFVFMLAFFFYGIIPGFGALTVREDWRKFRKRLLEATQFPFVSFSYSDRQKKEFLGKFRFFGHLEAIQGRDRIWINDGNISIACELKDISIYLLPTYTSQKDDSYYEKIEETLPDEELKSLPWNRIFSLPEGTQIFVAGSLFYEGGRIIFRSLQKEPLLVVIYDGEKKNILRKAIWGGRQKNEYWNQYTLISLITGSFSLFLVGYIFLNNPALRLHGLLSITLSLFPIAALLLPGFFLYIPYKILWKKARWLRAQRDLFRLPLRHFQSGQEIKADEIFSSLSTGETYVMASGELIMIGTPRIATQSQDIMIHDNLMIRGSGISKLIKSDDTKYYAFGAYKRIGMGKGELKSPEDPMAELVLIRGNPAVLAVECGKKAFIYNILSALVIFTDLIINLFLIFFLLYWFFL